ncbi:MAG: hypothetical protein PVI90_19630 [Desulfobacteraceae bacterium]
MAKKCKFSYLKKVNVKYFAYFITKRKINDRSEIIEWLDRFIALQDRYYFTAYTVEEFYRKARDYYS